MPAWKRPSIQIAFLIGLGMAATFWPVPVSVTLPCEVEPVTVAKVAVPRDGVIATHLVGAGEAAHQAAPLARYQTADLEHDVAQAKDRAAAAELQIAQLGEQVDPARVAKLTTQLEKRQASLQKALDKEQKARDAPPSKRHDKKVESAEARTAKAKAKVEETQGKLQDARHDSEIAQLKKAVADAAAEQTRLRAAIEGAVIPAPADGIYLPGVEGPDAHVGAGQDFGRIVDPGHLHLSAGAPASLVAADVARLTLVLPPGQAGVLRDPQWVSGQLEATVDGPPPALPIAGASVVVDLGKRPWIMTVLRPIAVAPPSPPST